jgi:hypothetical protein
MQYFPVYISTLERAERFYKKLHTELTFLIEKERTYDNHIIMQYFLVYIFTFERAERFYEKLHTELTFLIEKERTYENHTIMQYNPVYISTFERAERFYKTWLEGYAPGGCPRNVLYNFLQS